MKSNNDDNNDAKSKVTEPVQRQLEAYNAKDLDAFMSCYDKDICIYRMPSSSSSSSTTKIIEPALTGAVALREFYAKERFTIPALRAEVLQRMVVGNNVMDHERVYGLSSEPSEIMVVYDVNQAAGLIQNAWFYKTDS